MEKYRLQYHNTRKTVLSINWAQDRNDYITGDCRVRAITQQTDIDPHNKSHFQQQPYTPPMTIEESRAFISQNLRMLGHIHDCVGLTLDDISEEVEFDKRIEVRNFPN